MENFKKRKKIFKDVDKETAEKLEVGEVVMMNPPEVEVEKEVTRAEKFEVVEGQTNVVLKKYHVVIGSFGNKDNALRLQAQMRPQYEPIIVRNDKGMYRVLLMTYDTYKEAKTKILEVRNQFPDAWVLVMQNS